MVFLSSQVKLEDLPDSKEEICNYEWFLFSIMIKTKNIQYDDALNIVYDKLQWYPFVHKETLFNYLMTDKYYFKSNLYKTMEKTAEIVCMSKIHVLQTTNEKILIPEEKRIFKEKDIMNMFDYFKRNNFRENPICQYVLSSKKISNEGA